MFLKKPRFDQRYLQQLTRNDSLTPQIYDRLEYRAAIEVTAAAPLPEGMVSLQVPASTYARFEHRGPAPRVDHTVRYA